MADDILKKDTEILFPHVAVIKASAGSGKTHALTKRFVQFILSDKIPRNRLRNILAVTFSNNAAREMRERVLQWLKAVCLNDPEKTSELMDAVSLDRETLAKKSGQLIDEILNNYSDFQVRTIDSFMATVFKASALDFGYNPDFDILMSNDALMEYSFNLFLRKVREGTSEAAYLEEIIDSLNSDKKSSASYLWDPSAEILEESKNIYRKLASTGERPVNEDFSGHILRLKYRMQADVEAIEDEIVKSGLGRSSNSSYANILRLLKGKNFADLIEKGMKNPPVKKPAKTQTADLTSYELILKMWADFGGLVREYAFFYACLWYAPYLKVYEAFREIIEKTKRHQGKVFIEDINRNLSEYINEDIVPDIYFRIGDSILHFLIDEFQDTSPIQWRNIFPLIDNSLSMGGSLFAVGDTKQAIYGFRDADYKIMKHLESENPFRSAQHIVRELGINYRSREKILEFSEKVFKGLVADSPAYKEAGQRSGLTDYVQKVKDGKEGSGYAEADMLEGNEEATPEREKIQQLVEELSARGYKYRDMAVLTQKNEDAVRVAAWLNEKDIPFISFSSLDARKRKITLETAALLNFLDSPTDDFSFAAFITGDMFMQALRHVKAGISISEIREFLFANRKNTPVYKAFQKEFSGLWDRFFSGLFRAAGYFPLYDLVSEIFNVFMVFETSGSEEAALVKILETVNSLEAEGCNNLRDLLEAVDDEDTETKWHMDVPKDLDAVKIMTIHKSKGLGFPVVIVLLYEDRNKGFGCVLQEADTGVRLLKITRDIAQHDPMLEAVYNEEKTNRLTDKLNALYVGFTRPEEELYVIGVRGGQKAYPFDLLPGESFPSAAKPDHIRTSASEVLQFARTVHFHENITFRFSPDELIAAEERQRGELIHRVLSFVDYAGEDIAENLSSIIRKAKEEAGAEYSENEIRDAVMAVIRGKETAGFFMQRPGREIKNEQEFCDSDGRLFRMDRIIIDKDAVTVLDFKTGRDKKAEEKHRTQMKNYMKIICEVYADKAVEGLIVYTDPYETRRMS